ncbi:Puromycin resistance protein pur8, partial [Streptomyces rubellomurinus subsp. indigoferus]
GAIAGGGGAIGLILGGLLTEYMNGRWTFFVNTPFAIVAAAGAVLVIREPAEGRNRSGRDVRGERRVTSGLVRLVRGCTRGELSGWLAGSTLALFGAAGALLTAFVLVER